MTTDRAPHDRGANARKSRALGMSFGTARSRLDRDLVYHFAVAAGHKCFRCGGQLTREDFSVDHKRAWLNAENPKQTFFSLENIAFSHLHCNQKEMVDRIRKPAEHHLAWDAAYKRARYTPEARRRKYLSKGY